MSFPVSRRPLVHTAPKGAYVKVLREEAREASRAGESLQAEQLTLTADRIELAPGNTTKEVHESARATEIDASLESEKWYNRSIVPSLVTGLGVVATIGLGIYAAITGDATPALVAATVSTAAGSYSVYTSSKLSQAVSRKKENQPLLQAIQKDDRGDRGVFYGDAILLERANRLTMG